MRISHVNSGGGTGIDLVGNIVLLPHLQTISGNLATAESGIVCVNEAKVAWLRDCCKTIIFCILNGEAELYLFPP